VYVMVVNLQKTCSFFSVIFFVEFKVTVSLTVLINGPL
jgi:hypothetical protein